VRIDPETRDLVRRALREDLGRRGDLTTLRFLPPARSYSARIVAKAEGILCGRALADEVFRRACPSARLRWRFRDGNRIRRGDVLCRIRGPRGILTAERTALNFLQHLSGIATLTDRYAARVRGTRARVYDTRKTLPGWRALAKYAVRTGGGRNHRMGLHDMVLLKDNHLTGWGLEGPGDPGIPSPAVVRRLRAFRRRHPRVPVEIEARDAAEVRLALALGADLILLDNMPRAVLRRNIRFIRERSPKTRVEVSGGVDLRSVTALARLGPDRISVGRLTHSAPALDLSLKLDP